MHLGMKKRGMYVLFFSKAKKETATVLKFGPCTMGIFAAEKRINKEGWNSKNQRKTD